MIERKSSKLPREPMDWRRACDVSRSCCSPLTLDWEAEWAVGPIEAVLGLLSVLATYCGVRGDADESERSASECASSGTTPPPNSRLLAPLLVERGPAAKLIGERVPEEPSRVPGRNLAPLPMPTLLPRVLTAVVRVADGGRCMVRVVSRRGNSDSMGVVGCERELVGYADETESIGKCRLLRH